MEKPTLQDLVVDCNAQVFSKKSKIEETAMTVPFVPEEIMLKIFLLLPAQVLHDVLSLVCRTWRKVIRDPVFIEAHFPRKHDNSLLKIVDFDKYFKVYSINKDGTSWNPIRRFNQEYLTHGDGLILTIDCKDHSVLYLLNPITNQILTIPHPSPKDSSKFYYFAVAYSPSTLKYKVVCTTFSSRMAYVLTIGVDKEWRKIHMEPDFRNVFLSNCLQGVWGYIYWHRYSIKSIIVLDLAEEIFYKCDFPEEVEGMVDYGIRTTIRSDGIPSIAVTQNYTCWHFWELVDHKNGGQWQKLGILDIEKEWRKFSEIKPRDKVNVLGLKNKDEAIFRYSNYTHFFAYNFKTGRISRSFNGDSMPRKLKLMLTNTLVVL